MKRIKWIRNEEGSILVSTFALLLFLSFMITTVTGIVYHQAYQLNQISMAYETKAMLQMTSRLIEEEWDKGNLESGQLTFSKGTVTVQRLTKTSVSVQVAHVNGQSRTETLSIDHTTIE